MPRALKYFLIIVLGFFLYVATAIPLGIWFYSMKSRDGIDLFRTTGVHSYISCLQREAGKAKIELQKRAMEEKAGKPEKSEMPQ